MNGEESTTQAVLVREPEGVPDPVVPDVPPEPPETVEVRRNAGLSAAVGALASAVAIAWLARASSSAELLDWAVSATVGLVGIAHLLAFLDARSPLLVADAHGVRIRLGRSWQGMPWSRIEEVEHTPRRGVLRDGRLVLLPRDPEGELVMLDRGARRHARLAARVLGDPFAVPLGVSTRVSVGRDQLTSALLGLADADVTVVEVDPRLVLDEPVEDEPSPDEALVDEPVLDDAVLDEPEPEPEPEPELTAAFEAEAGPDHDPDSGHDPEPSPSPLRSPVTVIRSELTRLLHLPGAARHAAGAVSGSAAGLVSGTATALRLDAEPESEPTVVVLPEVEELRRGDPEATEVWGPRVAPISRPGAAVDPIVIDDDVRVPAADPVVGPELAAARTRLGLSVDQLAERTRIRPHVIESIEVDDFAPCGGDFYARGHLRTLARVVGIEVTPLLAAYDARYADAPIDARRVFEAELATGSHGSIRGTRSGPNWSVLVAAVMALVLAWSVARLVMDGPVDLAPTPILNGSGGPNNATQLGEPVPVTLIAAGGGAHVEVRDGSGELVFTGDLAFGETRTLEAVTPPARVQTSDGSVQVAIDGGSSASVGETGQPAQETYVVR